MQQFTDLKTFFSGSYYLHCMIVLATRHNNYVTQRLKKDSADIYFMKDFMVQIFMCCISALHSKNKVTFILCKALKDEQ